MKLVAYTNDANFKDEWQLITDRTYLGALTTTWHSDASSVGYWDLDGTSKSISVYVENLNTSEALFYFNSGTNEAIDQWENLLNISFSRVYDEGSGNIKVYGGTRDQIEDHGEYTGTTWTGLSSTSFYIDGMMNVNGGNEIITINRIIRARIDIISRTDTDAVRKCIAHEFGHSLGYSGHAPNSTDVMYAYSHGSYSLKTLESNHIKVIYDLYNK